MPIATDHEKLQALQRRLTEINDLESAAAVLAWDQQTYMPPGGAAARARQMATLQRLAHEKLTDAAIGHLLDDLQSFAAQHPYDSDEASLIRVTRRVYERALQVPSAFVARFSEHSAASYDVWAKARPSSDFAAVRPYLEETVDLSRELASCFPGYEHIADPLIDFADYGMKASTVRAVFADLREQLVPIVRAITAQPPADDACLHRRYPEAEQAAFAEQVVRDFGYDYERGRSDLTAHPFTITFAPGDVRITVRYKETDLGEALFSFFHEAGHAIYEQGIDTLYEGTPLAEGTSSGVHESQSRLWENLVGRSRSFWAHYYPRLRDTFPAQLGDTSLDAFYRAINKVDRTLIRTDADEVTYNLHVMIRFDLGLALLEGALAVKDLPDAWNERYRSDLGVVPPHDGDGVMQDVHWYAGPVGGQFQGYTLGNILSAQFYGAAYGAQPGIADEVGRGSFGSLLAWLRENVYRYGSKYTASELVERVTGGPLCIEPYVSYLRQKYGELYAL